MLLSNIFYIIFGNGKQAWWDDVKKLGYPLNLKNENLTTISEIVVNEETQNIESSRNRDNTTNY